ncbi:MAG: energy transducer TonB [Brumimicrobium sp.]|nr:energy transducer TonB [Brumimicrobium sp.]MCO5267319.1 TonB family protein [Brumimicrobium sp.]
MEIKKNPTADNERLRVPLVFLGFFIIGSLITLSFSYKEEVLLAGGDRMAQSKDDIPEELEIIEQENEPEDEPVVQEIEDMEIPPEPAEEIETVKNQDKDEQVRVETITIDIKPEAAPAPEAPIIDYPDKEASFPGGAAAMKKFLADNVKYPEIAMELGDQGRVFVEFVVNKDGSIEQVKVLRGVSSELDKEAQRVVRSMPKWVPAEANGEKVRARCRIPINFILH